MKFSKRKTRKPLWLIKQIRAGTFTVTSHQLAMIMAKFGTSAAELSQNLDNFNKVLKCYLEKEEEEYE